MLYVTLLHQVVPSRGDIASLSVNQWPCRDPGLNVCACHYTHAGLGASAACGAGLKALQLASNLVFGMSIHAVSEETGSPIDLEPRAPVYYQLLKLHGSGRIPQKACFIPMCCFRGWDNHKMLSPGMERAVAGLAFLGNLLFMLQPSSAESCGHISGVCSALARGPRLL